MKKVVSFIGIALFLVRIFENYSQIKSPLGLALNTFGLICFLILLGIALKNMKQKAEDQFEEFVALLQQQLGGGGTGLRCRCLVPVTFFSFGRGNLCGKVECFRLENVFIFRQDSLYYFYLLIVDYLNCSLNMEFCELYL